MHIVATCQSVLYPSHHAIFSAHSIVHAPVGYLLFGCHFLEQFVHVWHQRIGGHLPVDIRGHITWTDKQYRCLGRTCTQVAHLLAQSATYISADGGRILRLWNHVATKLQDNQSCITFSIEVAELRAVYLRKDVSRASAHGDIVHNHTRGCLQTHAIHSSLALQMELIMCGAIR